MSRGAPGAGLRGFLLGTVEEGLALMVGESSKNAGFLRESLTARAFRRGDNEIGIEQGGNMLPGYSQVGLSGDSDAF